MTKSLFRLRQFIRFYATAVTKYQLHSPFVFELAETVLEDKRWYYAFRDIELLRGKMMQSKVILELRDFGTGKDGKLPLRKLVRRAASSAGQGQKLFRLANWANPRTILELGTSVGIGALYLISGARSSRMISLEGCPETAQVARKNLDLLEFKKQVELKTGPFEQTLEPALKQLQRLDFVFFDGNHRLQPTWEYFNQCLPFAQENTVFVFDDIYWSEEMKTLWQKLQKHPQVTLTVDFFDLSLAFINPDFKQKQHVKIVPSSWKIWKFF